MPDPLEERANILAVVPCHCIGPQNGEPMCPCRMRDRGIFQRNGRWIEPERDYGPVQPNGKTARAIVADLQQKYRGET